MSSKLRATLLQTLRQANDDVLDGNVDMSGSQFNFDSAFSESKSYFPSKSHQSTMNSNGYGGSLVAAYHQQQAYNSHQNGSFPMDTPYHMSEKADKFRNGATGQSMPGLSLGSILTMATQNRSADNPFEPTPLHPSLEGKSSDSFKLEGKVLSAKERAAKRRLSVCNALDSLFGPDSDFNLDDEFDTGRISPSMLDDDDEDDQSDLIQRPDTASNVRSSSNDLNENSNREIDVVSPSIASYPSFDEIRCDMEPTLSLYRLKQLMARSRVTQNMLQEWDKKNGLPRSHSCTMMHTNRSRRQLEDGRILPKWNGAPLIGDEEAKPKRKRVKKEDGRSCAKKARISKKPRKSAKATLNDSDDIITS